MSDTALTTMFLSKKNCIGIMLFFFYLEIIKCTNNTIIL